jgi:glycosyltransferase involved in cell wall biosynthesis/trans-aconitate methyltransferase
MRVLFALTYYRPHISGLTIHVRKLAEGLAEDGHGVTVLTSRYHRGLAGGEEMGGVRVMRVPVWWRVGKGVVSPGMLPALRREIRAHDLVLLSVPANPDLVRWCTRLVRRLEKPLLIVYACDVRFGRGPGQRLLEWVCRREFSRALAQADRVLVLSQDYADHSPHLAPCRKRVVAIAPPIEMPEPGEEDVLAVRARFGLRSDHRHVVLAARLAEEKGVEYLLEALAQVNRRNGPSRLIITGDQSAVIGERAYRRRIDAGLAALQPPAVFTGALDTREMASVFAAADVSVLPSVNATESFGMVQVESMLCGTPVVATSLPGVREPVSRTGMGRLVPPGDAGALASAIGDVLEHPALVARPRDAIESAYSYRQSRAATTRLVAGTVEAHRAQRTVQRERLAEYRRQARSIPAFRALVRAAEVCLLEQLEPIRRPSLDFGCGDGHFASALGHRFDAGVDVDPRALHEAARMVAHRLLLHTDHAALPFADGAFETIVANSTLEHVSGLGDVLAELARVLRPGGRLLVTVPTHRFADLLGGASLLRRARLTSWSAAYGAWFNRRSRHVTIESPEQWIARLGAHGLETLTWRGYLSPDTHQGFDVLHYVGVPNLLARALTGRWVVPALQPLNALVDVWVRRALRARDDDGPYCLIVAERR